MGVSCSSSQFCHHRPLRYTPSYRVEILTSDRTIRYYRPICRHRSHRLIFPPPAPTARYRFSPGVAVASFATRAQSGHAARRCIGAICDGVSAYGGQNQPNAGCRTISCRYNLIPSASSCASAGSAQPRLATGLAGLGCKMRPMRTSISESVSSARFSAN